MGQVKAMAMDLEDQFFDAAAEVVMECECYEEFFELMKRQIDMVAHMDITEVDSALTEIWNEYWSYYV